MMLFEVRGIDRAGKVRVVTVAEVDALKAILAAHDFGVVTATEVRQVSIVRATMLRELGLPPDGIPPWLHWRQTSGQGESIPITRTRNLSGDAPAPDAVPRP